MFKVGQTVIVNQGGITYTGTVVKVYETKLLLTLNDNGQMVVDMKYCTPMKNKISERD
ncbi:hypothetical protein [Bacillus phage vB_BanS-Thrax5]|nr:hypothetical protein [Bacillus phage vB_BanS-Thrax5]